MAAVIFFCSDTCTQFIIPEKDYYDLSRALSGASFGIVATTWLHFWWQFLERAVEVRVPLARHKLANTLIKVIIDQGFGAPLYIFSYYVITNVLGQLRQAQNRQQAQQAVEQTTEKAKQMLWPTMMQHYRLWPFVHSISFYFVPLHHRVLVQNTVLVGWSGYLSHLNHSSGHILTPSEEIEVTIVRRETELRLEREQQERDARTS